MGIKIVKCDNNFCEFNKRYECNKEILYIIATWDGSTCAYNLGVSDENAIPPELKNKD